MKNRVGERVGQVLALPFELHRQAHRCEIAIPLPGVRSQDVVVHVEDRTVTIAVHVEHELVHGARGSIVEERHAGTATRSFTLAEPIDTRKARATLDHGALRVVLPLGAQGSPRTLALDSP